MKIKFVDIMRRVFISAALALVAAAALAQSKPSTPEYDLTFTTVKANPITSIKNQASSGTCWAY